MATRKLVVYPDMDLMIQAGAHAVRNVFVQAVIKAVKRGVDYE